jgi:hypothetical protein
MCVRAQTSAVGIAIRFDYLKKERKQARDQKVDITNTSHTEKDQQPQQSPVEVQAAEGSFRQPTAAELLSLLKLRYARSQAQESSNEFARLLNRGSSLE